MEEAILRLIVWVLLAILAQREKLNVYNVSTICIFKLESPLQFLKFNLNAFFEILTLRIQIFPWEKWLLLYFSVVNLSSYHPGCA